uniref:Coiled-coil domain containing 34 n=1 Tax=Salvator merianae TaxID=96440 RepID=A0A8D0AXZ4_SALMN
ENDLKVNVLPVEDNLSPWEEWFLCKEREIRARLQARAIQDMNQQLEKRKEIQERERKKIIAEEKHREWVLKKNEEEKRERELKLSKEMAEKAAKELERAQSKQRAKEMYEEWLKKKKAEEVQKKKEEKEKERQREAELQEKKEKSERMFKEWLQNSKNKPRPPSTSHAYGNADGNVYPIPAFCNPIPWKPIHVPPPKEEKYVSVKKNKTNKTLVSNYMHKPFSVFVHKPNNKLCIGLLHRNLR